MALEQSSTLSRITGEWKAGRKAKPLIDHWKIEMMKELKKGQFPCDFYEELNVISINPFSENHKQLKEKFDNKDVQSQEEKLGLMGLRGKVEEAIQKRCVVLTFFYC